MSKVERDRRYRRERMAAGYCTTCLSVFPPPGRRRCDACVAARRSRLWALRASEAAGATPARLEKMRAYSVAYNRRLRAAALAAYGGVCACCGEARPEFLALDHIDGGGTAHRRSLHIRTERWVQVNGYPPGFRVLCHNCNFSLGKYDYCPHQREKGLSE